MSDNTPKTTADSGVNNEGAFRDYLSKLDSVNNNNTVDGYLRALKDKIYEDVIGSYESIFQIDDLEFFKSINPKVREKDDFDQFNIDRARRPSAALNNYQNFLLKQTIEKKPEWLGKKAEEYSDIETDANQRLEDFKEKFSPEELDKLNGVELLNTIFHNTSIKENLCDTLIEKDEIFGNIDIDYKQLGLYCKNRTKLTWMDASGNTIPRSEAIKLGTEIKNNLVAGAKTIEKALTNALDRAKKERGSLPDPEGGWKLEDYWELEDYGNLEVELKNEIGDYSEKVWFLKYYFMLFPELFSTYYTEDLQKRVLGIIGAVPEGSPLVRNGQICLFANEHNISNVMFSIIFSEYAVIKKRKSDNSKKKSGGDIDDDPNYTADYNNETVQDFPLNRIFFGAPGTGKSFTLDKEKNELLGGDDEDERRMRYERVTFHPDYSYANFVGTYKPVPKSASKDSADKNSADSDVITYKYVPGPFMRTYVKAVKSSMTGDPKPYLLIIEEINRANVAAVFGDVFQLLDRNKDGTSEYPIQASEDVKKYLASNSVLGGNSEDDAVIRIPSNMYIWATMNSADQGVFPMDTAFKRRWDFTYRGIDEGEKEIDGKTVTLGTGNNERKVNWNELRKAINDKLLEFKVNEDKLMGPFFINLDSMMLNDKEINPEKFKDVFKNKVIMYLFDDAAKRKSPELFKGCDNDKEIKSNQYSKICEEFDKKGVFIFCKEISDKFLKKDEQAQQGAPNNTPPKEGQE